MVFFTFLCIHFLFVNAKDFTRITDLLDEASEVIPNMAFSASTEDEGRVYTYEHGDITMDTVVEVASTSKWPSTATILRQAGLGKFSLDIPICKYFDWWSCNATDDPFGVPRANVTVKIAMSFMDGTAGLGTSPVCPNNETTFEECAKGLYNVKKIWQYVPNSTFDYNEYHLQFGGAVAEKVSGTTIDVLLNETLTSLNMTDSFYGGGKTPDISGRLSTTGNDYDKFLYSLYHKTLPGLTDELYAEMESDYTVGKQYTSAGKIMLGYIGHYGLGNWLDCGFIDYNNMTLWPWCVEHPVRSCIGVHGYYPAIDRTRKFWNQLVVAKSRDPAQGAMGIMLGRVVKDELDVILAPDVRHGQNSCLYLSFVLKKKMLSHFGVTLNSTHSERVHLLARKLRKVLGC